MVRAFVVGIGITNFEEPGDHDDIEFGKAAINKALNDCNLTMADIQACTINGYMKAEHRTLYGMNDVDIYNNQQSGAVCLQLARRFVDEGKYDSVIALGYEKKYLTALRGDGGGVNDGGSAVVVASEKFVKEHNLEQQAVEILGMEMTTTVFSPLAFNNYDHLIRLTKQAADRLFEKSSVQPIDIQVAEIDTFTQDERIVNDALHLTIPGKPNQIYPTREENWSGRYIFSNDDGLVSKGNTLGPGLAQCIELCRQLRFEAGADQVKGARVAFQYNCDLGGTIIVALYAKPAIAKNIDGNVDTRKVDASEDGYLVTPYIQLLHKALHDDKNNITKRFNGTYQIRVKKPNGQKGTYDFNFKVEEGKIELHKDLECDTWFEITDADAFDFFSGRLYANKAFFNGRVKAGGNLFKAVRIGELQRVLMEDLADLRAKL